MKSDKKAVDWKVLGQFFSMLLGLFTIVRDTFAKQNVGIEVVSWLNGDGRQEFVKNFLQPLAEAYVRTQCWRTVSKTCIEVNLDAPLRLPFEDAQVVWPETPGKLGWVKVERQGDKLFVDGREVTLYLTDEQRTGAIIKGHDLWKALKGKPVVHTAIMWALLDNPHLIPDGLKRDEQNRTRYIYFWAVGFCGSRGDLCVLCLCWRGGGWRWGCGRLGGGWGSQGPAALLAS